MKHQKRLFNHLLRRYNKCIRRVNRLIGSGTNVRRQYILQGQIDRLREKLLSLQLYLKRGAVMASVAVATIAIDGNAQNFGAPSTNPYGLSFFGNLLSSASMVDLDNDGDLDILCGEYNTGGSSFFYYENLGSASLPVFGAPQTNPFGLISNGTSFNRPDFVDLDGDGDFDILSGSSTGNFYYYENTGNNTSPSFSAPSTDPFGLTYTGGAYMNVSCVDIDNDGDFDLMAGDISGGDMKYYENVGSSSSPSFAAMQVNPFSLTSGYLAIPAAGFSDIDNDGD
ncbi:MAG: VCBS repeat-containing protein, partial [Flavobacteriales bacterium]|nr:VCBS repeat-containing protein [Flavobacteriales bacterium]